MFGLNAWIKWGQGGFLEAYFSCLIMSICLMRLFWTNGVHWSEIRGTIVIVVCVNQCQSLHYSLRRELQRLSFEFCSCISPRQCDLVLGDKSSRLSEYASPKREFVCNCVDWMNNSRRRGWLLFWAGVRLVQARPSRLSEISREGLGFCWTSRRDEAF